MRESKSFASDNWAGIHPDILKAIVNANSGHVPAYGKDRYTANAIAKFKEHFGSAIDVFFVFNGTAANVLSLRAMAASYHSIICPSSAHFNVDECGAPENFIGCKVTPVETKDGKLTINVIASFLHAVGNEHHVQPKVVSISQSTELGTVYKISEIKAIADFAHSNGLLLHMDGARLANAAASLNVPLKAMTADVGVDVLSFGGTKNGMLGGEAIIFFNKELVDSFKYIRKQGMQLASKMRFIAAQFETLLSHDLWLENAKRANQMAQRLADELRQFPWIEITRQVESNGVFVILPKELIPLLQEKFFFWVWDHARHEVRLMTSFDTTLEDLEQFVEEIRKLSSRFKSNA